MICRQCRSSLLSRLPSSRPASAAYSYSHIPSRQPHRFYSAATPAAPAADAASPASPKTATKAAPKIVSSVPAGTKLAGLNYEKNKQDPIALEDHEYPDWLWTLLDKTAKKSETGAGSVDVSNMNKKARKKHEKKMAALAASQPRAIPVHEQATDITPAEYNAATTGEAATDNLETATAGLEARSEITKSARNARRKAIKESNFLRGL
ncbi:TPA_exp: Uncharacterized protein A8136_6292 [Trichophyton benhamiae CBS 112371]|uniref:Large ribosomal subunit protein mL54 n=1 Tax=Arthroderma benhamiae (strain ATCC MYA-4681 / CBS 112371) TaxID=663331 RepID=D4AQT5_ARTBC|nr:uncharacterized protein ARB_06595 [Trichophyton benhamiae CBS 112371]EFE34829.1 conserved hypothetical protein [Trichophyton benhamiae CBS 112371]DAA77746.1 TPA_exp: Uncharacterized protein A8136_6292 [Trichophyton benhamiae CBS 112371]